MRYYFKLIKTFIKQSFLKESAFRFDFYIKLLNIVLSLAGIIGGIAIIYSRTEALNGWGFAETLALTGIYFLVNSIKNLFIAPSLSALSDLGGDIWTGKFDLVLVKPVKTQFYVSLRNWSPLTILDFLVSIIILAVAAYQLRLSLNLLDILLFMLAMLISLTIMYSILMILSSISFWYLGSPVLWLYDSIIQMGRFPVKIYPGFMKHILTWVVPVGFIISVPANILVAEINCLEIIGGLFLAVFLFVTASLFFNISLKHYASASS